MTKSKIEKSSVLFRFPEPKNDQAATKKSTVRFAVYTVRLMPQRTFPFFRFYPQKQR